MPNQRRRNRSLLHFGPLLLVFCATTEIMQRPGPDAMVMKRIDRGDSATPRTIAMRTTVHNERGANTTTTSAQYYKRKQRIHPGPICMLHVGKTAGSLLACAFGFPLPTCNITQQHTRNIPDLQRLSRRVRMGGHSHVGTYSCNPQAAAYIVPIRNPIERIRSWFYFEQTGVGGLHTDACYHNSFERLVDNLESAVNSTFPVAVENMTCAQTAWAALMGARRIGCNSFYNFEYYYGEAQRHPPSHGRSKEQPMLVVRTEHIEADINAANRLIGGKGAPGTALAAVSTNAGTHYNSKHQSNASSSVLSLASLDLTFLCRALCRDIQYYKRFLFRASNLQPSQIQESIQHVGHYCPNETEVLREDCADHVPWIPRATSDSI